MRMLRKSLSFLLLLSAILLLAGAVSAQSMLEISEVTVKVDGDKQSADEGGGNIDIKPESTLELKIQVDNLFDSGVEGGEIEDVEIEAILYEIDDDDDLEESADSFDLRPGRDKTVTIKFEIPLLLQTDATYELKLSATGDDQNNTDHYDEVVFDVDVDKESHELRFIKKELLPEVVECGKDQTQLRFEILNTGQEDEDVDLTVTAPNLGYSETDEFEIVEDIDDDDNLYSFSDNIDLSNAAPGTYSVIIRAEYNRGREVLEDTLSLLVEECEATPAPKPEPTPEPEQKPTTPAQNTPSQSTPSQSTSSQVEVVSSPSTPYVRQGNIAIATPKTSYSSGGWWDDNKWIVIIIVADIVLIAIGIAVVLAILHARKR